MNKNMRSNKVLCECELDGMCVDHLRCEEQRLLQLYQRSLRSNKSKMMTLSYMCGLSKIYYDLDNHQECINYSLKAETSFAKLNIVNEQRVDVAINILQSYLVLGRFIQLRVVMEKYDKILPAEHIPYKLLSQTMKERILFNNDDTESYLAWLRIERKYCHELKWIQHREEELIYLEALTLYRLRCFIGANEIIQQLKAFQQQQLLLHQESPGKIGIDLPLDPKHDELDSLIKRALIDRKDIEKHPWNLKTVCYNCWKVGTGDGGRCAGCNLVHFCSPDCQNANWLTHKFVCKSRSSAPE